MDLSESDAEQYLKQPDPKKLLEYSPCDVSDALLAIGRPDKRQQKLAGFFCDVVHRKSANEDKRCIGPAFTIQFQPKDDSENSSLPRSHLANLAMAGPWSDLVEPNSIVVVQQPEGQKNAVVGGIHMERLRQRGVRALVVDGRIRDMDELAEIPLAVYSKGTSTVGAGAASWPYALQQEVTVSGVRVEPDDIIFADANEGVVSIPEPMLIDVVEWLEKRGDSEEQIKSAVRSGISVGEALDKYR